MQAFSSWFPLIDNSLSIRFHFSVWCFAWFPCWSWLFIILFLPVSLFFDIGCILRFSFVAAFFCPLFLSLFILQLFVLHLTLFWCYSFSVYMFLMPIVTVYVVFLSNPWSLYFSAGMLLQYVFFCMWYSAFGCLLAACWGLYIILYLLVYFVACCWVWTCSYSEQLYWACLCVLPLAECCLFAVHVFILI